MSVESGSPRHGARPSIGRFFEGPPALSWTEIESRFLEAVQPAQRPLVSDLLRNWHKGGRGLRNWLREVSARGAQLPDSIPRELVEVYLSDPDAEPGHDCRDCGIAIPIHPYGGSSLEVGSDYVYFSLCPLCGGRTGKYAYWSNTTPRDGAEGDEVLSKQMPQGVSEKASL